MKNRQEESIDSLISDLRALFYNWYDDDSRCTIEGFHVHPLVEESLVNLQAKLIIESRCKDGISD